MIIIFDLDGTLIDSSRDLAISVNATRAHFDLPPLEQHVVNSYVGNGAAVLMQRAMGDVPDATVAEAHRYFLKYYRTHALQHTHLYQGVREMLDGLVSHGHQLAVLTNKPRRISFDILDAVGVGQSFRCVYGGDSFATKKPEPDGILRILEDVSGEPSRAIMVGDSKVDVQTALNAGIASCGVRWGFQPETFKEVPPDHTIEEPGELLDLIARLDRHADHSMLLGNSSGRRGV